MNSRTPLYTHLIEQFGWSIIRLGFRSKVPIKGESPLYHSIEKHDLKTVLDHYGNLGIMGGEISGIVIVDLDSYRSVKWAQNNLPETPLRQCTHKGEHWIYRLPPEIKIGPKVGKEIPGEEGLKIDLRGETSYAVGPYGLHPDGGLYEPMTDWTKVDLADVPELPKVLHPEPEPPRQENVLRLVTRRQPVLNERDRLRDRLDFFLSRYAKPSIEGQEGQCALFHAVCSALSPGWGDEHLIADCIARWDQAYSVPPWGREVTDKMVNRCLSRFWNGECLPFKGDFPEDEPKHYKPSESQVRSFLNEYYETGVDGLPAANPQRPDRGGSPTHPGPPRDGDSARIVGHLRRLLREIPGSDIQ